MTTLVDNCNLVENSGALYLNRPGWDLRIQRGSAELLLLVVMERKKNKESSVCTLEEQGTYSD